MPNTGAAAKLGLGAVGTATAQLEFVSENISLQEQLFISNGIRGERSRYKDRTRLVRNSVGGPVVFQPNKAEMALLLPWIMCGTPSGGGTITYPLDRTAVTRGVVIDRVTRVFTYLGCGVNTAMIRCSRGEPLAVELGLVGQSEGVGAAGTFPVLDVDVATGPWVFSDAVVSIAGTSINLNSLSLSINNFIDADRFFNSLNLTAVNMLDREITIDLSGIPYTEYVALYASGGAGASVAVVATFTNGAHVLTMTMPNVTLPTQSPVVPGRTEISFDRQGVCLATGPLLQDELTVTIT